MTRYDKILGNLIGGAMGDSMGAPTEERSTAMILRDFGGYVTEFLDSPLDTWAHGAAAGMVTDDFSLAYFTAQAIAENGGHATTEAAQKALLKWCEYPEYFDYNVGPTTRAAIEAMKGKKVEKKPGAITPAADNGKATNGAAMKIGPMGLFSGGDIDRAIDDAITVCLPTHRSDISLSGACAVAAAVAKGLDPAAGIYEMVEAGMYGARRGMELGGKVGDQAAGPSVEKRIWLAASIGMKAGGDWEKGMCEVRDIIGNGLMTVEAVPAAFGLFVSAGGDVMKTVYGGANIGGDTDTIACIAGCIAGTYAGTAGVPERYLDLIEEKNKFDLRGLARQIEELL
ncbi:ADP-ribosyl-[dinitrogen reductase] hydrolase [Anaerotruncus sp. 2789STDY5834896]|uniref:ADP-ribosyl-[dinitrogen reductase] hydrolase n=1 Tax=uncultured Anaerotruncus sp. TaxID=905011 RepID=A0A1C6ITN4_9FIRM|nr:ADP-ribosyl-[dinitrogen reductase] hydrolase [uncultured Anaerotruncus sp.]